MQIDIYIQALKYNPQFNFILLFLFAEGRVRYLFAEGRVRHLFAEGRVRHGAFFCCL